VTFHEGKKVERSNATPIKKNSSPIGAKGYQKSFFEIGTTFVPPMQHCVMEDFNKLLWPS
jgi:hypothetical protein